MSRFLDTLELFEPEDVVQAAEARAEAEQEYWDRRVEEEKELLIMKELNRAD